MDPTINTAGIVPLKKCDEEWKVFLIHHHGYEEFWGFPKGHVEPNETHVQAAIRELKEETGLQFKSLLREEPILEEFYWYKEGERKFKRILYFMAEVDGDVHLQKEEIANGRWFTLSEAKQKIAHKEGKATLQIVKEALDRE